MAIGLPLTRWWLIKIFLARARFGPGHELTLIDQLTADWRQHRQSGKKNEHSGV